MTAVELRLAETGERESFGVRPHTERVPFRPDVALRFARVSKLTRWSGKVVADERTWCCRAKIGIVPGQEASKLMGLLSGGQKWPH
jgi:hypothetical protein